MNLSRFKLIWLGALILATPSFFSFADSCLITEAIKQEYNDKHQHKVVVETTLNDSQYFVNISLPATVEGQELQSVWLVSGSMDDPSFIAPLEVFADGDLRTAWYNIDAEMARRHFIVVGFGEGCRPNIITEVMYQ